MNPEELKKLIGEIVQRQLQGVLGDTTPEAQRKLEADVRALQEMVTRSESRLNGEEKGIVSIETRAGRRTFNAEYLRKASGVIDGDRLGGLGLETARFYRAIAAEHASEGRVKAKDVARGWGDNWLADELDKAQDPGHARDMTRALGVEIAADGGYLVPEAPAAALIGLLRAKSVIMALGARIMPMVSTKMPMPVLTGGVTTTWVGENQQTNATQPTFGLRHLELHKTRTIVPLSYEFATMAGAEADMFVRDEIAKSMALAHDLKFLRGDGTNDTPKGLYNLAPAASKYAITAPAGSLYTAGEVKKELRGAIEKIEGANVPIDSLGIAMTSRTKNALASLADGNNNMVFESQLDRGELMGGRVGITNQLPKDLGSGDETEIYFAAFDEVFVGQLQNGMTIKAYDGATYRDSSGTMVSGLSNDQIILATRGHAGVQVAHPEAVAVLTAVDYDATI